MEDLTPRGLISAKLKDGSLPNEGILHVWGRA